MISKIKNFPIFLYHYIFDGLIDIGMIFNQRKTLGKSFNECLIVFNDYLKINLLFLLNKIFKFNHNKNSLIKILGYKIKFFNYEELRLLFREVFVQQTYHFKTKNDKPFIIDCGANTGISILFFKKIYPKSRILAFEPNKETFDVLEDNIKHNNLDDVTLVNAAVYNKEGSLTFYVDSKDAMTSVYNTVDKKWLKDTGNQVKEILVPCVKLSNFIDQEVDFFKIDVEGAEYEVFPEVEEKLEMIKRIGIEYHCSDNDDGNGPDKLLNILTRKGFKYVITGFINPPYSVIENKAYGGIIYAYRSK